MEGKLKDLFEVRPIPSEQCKDWLLFKHYAHRIPLIQFAYALYNKELLQQGICTYGPPARRLNDGYGIFGPEHPTPTYELNRLVVNEGLPENILSFFVSKTFDLMPKPSCLVSYADGNEGHHGYIYQSLNWLFTGQTKTKPVFFNTKTGKTVHARTVVSQNGSQAFDNLPEHIRVDWEDEGKYRYIYFLGNKKERKQMREWMKYKVEPYPKGDNKRYDASHETRVQSVLF